MHCYLPLQYIKLETKIQRLLMFCFGEQISRNCKPDTYTDGEGGRDRGMVCRLKP